MDMKHENSTVKLKQESTKREVDIRIDQLYRSLDSIKYRQLRGESLSDFATSVTKELIVRLDQISSIFAAGNLAVEPEWVKTMTLRMSVPVSVPVHKLFAVTDFFPEHKQRIDWDRADAMVTKSLRRDVFERYTTWLEEQPKDEQPLYSLGGFEFTEDVVNQFRATRTLNATIFRNQRVPWDELERELYKYLP